MQSRVTEATLVESSVTASAVRVASLATLSGTNFLIAYMVLHALHAAGRDPLFVKALSRIPLFSTGEAALLSALGVGVLGALSALDHDKLLARISKILAVTILLFTLEILLFPMSHGDSLCSETRRAHPWASGLAVDLGVISSGAASFATAPRALGRCACNGARYCDGILGAGLYPAYRVLLKPGIFAASPAIGSASRRPGPGQEILDAEIPLAVAMDPMLPASQAVLVYQTHQWSGRLCGWS